MAKIDGPSQRDSQRWIADSFHLLCIGWLALHPRMLGRVPILGPPLGIASCSGRHFLDPPLAQAFGEDVRHLCRDAAARGPVEGELWGVVVVVVG